MLDFKTELFTQRTWKDWQFKDNVKNVKIAFEHVKYL